MKKLLRLVPLIFFLSLIGLNAQNVTNTNTAENFASIQAAINDADTDNGHTLEVDDGTYNENLTINKELTIQSANGASFTTISASGGTAVQVTADNVTIDGFTITNPSGPNGVLVSGFGNFTLENSIVDGIGSALVSNTNVQGVYISPGIENVSSVSILSNTIQNIGNTSTGSTKGIYVGSTSNPGSLDGLTIDDNTIQQIYGNTAVSTPKGANGIQFNLSGGVSNADITNNTFSDINGYWARAIGLEGDTPNASIVGNNFSNITSEKAVDKYAIFFEDNPSAATVEIHSNDINTEYGLGIHSSLLPIASKINATDNWWGDATGPAGTDLNGSGAFFGDEASTASIVGSVLYSPWIGNDPDDPHGPNDPWTFYVDDSNPDALDDVLSSPNLLDGDIIIADGGTYSAVTINSEITLQGTNGAVIDNSSPAITVAANNVTIDGFTFVYDASDYAIYVDGDYSGTVVKNCTFNNTDGGGVNPGFSIDNETNNVSGYFVDATENNDWSGNGFPYNATTSPTGTGVAISLYVQYNEVTLLSPVNSLSGVSVKPEFSWELTGADGYRVQIATSTDFVNDLLVEHSVGSGVDSYKFSGYFHPEIPLDNNTQYYWRVVAEYGANEFNSSPWYFTTVANVNISLWNPGDGTEVYQYDPLQFTWSLNQAAGSLRFYVQLFEQGIAPDYVQIASYELTNAQNAGSNAVLYFENINDLYRTVNGLKGGTQYYWYVCAYYDDGSTPNVLDLEDRIVKYSSLFSFTTKGGAVTAYPSWPVGGATIYDLQPSFYWYTMTYEPSATYEVLYSTTSTTGGAGELTVGTTTVSAGSNTYVNVGTELLPSTTYYWQVKSTYGTEVKYSSVASFTTYDAPGLVPTAANPSYPTGGLEIYTTAPTFYWWIGGYNIDVNFTVEVSTNITFGDIDDVTFGPTTDTYVQASGLIPGQSYYWRIKSSKVGYADVYSSTAEFTVTGGLSSYPVATWPVGNPTVYSATPTLSWYMEGSTLGWTHYKVAISKKDWTPAEWLTRITTPDSVVYVTADMNETFYTFTSPLEYGEKYYWAVAAHDHPAGPYSDVAEGSFTIAGNNAAIVKLNPANNIVITTKSPQFTWYVSGSILGVTHYRVTYSDTELFTANIETVVTTSTSADVNGALTEGSIYYWYVELSYDGGSTWENATPTWKFTVDPGASAVVPIAGSPAKGVTIGTNTPVLSWYLPAQSESALSYEVELADNQEFSNAIVYNDISELRSQVEGLEEGEYFWRVKSKTSGSESSYSSTANFKVGTVTDVNEEEELPLTYSIEQNYPNPFNPTTTINYAIPQTNYVTVKIYNMLGQEVKTLVSQEVKAGRHTLNWVGDNNYGSKVASGTYIYRITAGEFVQAKKMILLK